MGYVKYGLQEELISESTRAFCGFGFR